MKIYMLIPMLVAGMQPCAAYAPEPRTAQDADPIRVVGGRTAGQPASCVSMRRLRGSKIVGDGAILFTTSSSKLFYVNRPQKGCPELNRSRGLRTDTVGTHLCRGDVVTVFKPRTHTEYGTCRLGDFVPYRGL